MARQSQQAEQALALIADDPEVKAAAKQLALEALEAARWLLVHGNDVTKMRVIGSMLPAFQKSLTQDKSKSTETEEMKQDLASLRAEMMGDTGVNEEDGDGTPTISTD